jgi:hypothetical protein
MGVSNASFERAMLANRYVSLFDHPQNAFYSQVVSAWFTFLNKSRTTEDTHHDDALPIIMFGKIDLVGQSCRPR